MADFWFASFTADERAMILDLVEGELLDTDAEIAERGRRILDKLHPSS